MRIGNSEVKAESCVKLLGVYFEQELSFNAHIDEMCRKAGRKLSVLDSPRHISSKMLIFILLYYHALTTLNVCGTFVERKMKKVEIIQKQSLRYVCNDHRYTNMHQELISLDREVSCLFK